MFEETEALLNRTQSVFDSRIQDSFGKSIDEKVFEPAGGEIRRLELAYAEAERRMHEINAITAELRTIL